LSEEQTITKEPETEQKPKEWEPRIIGFLCNWCPNVHLSDEVREEWVHAKNE